MLLVLILCLCMVAATFAIGGRELKGFGMPVAGSCSFALAAASHRPRGDVDAAVLPVRWGEVEEMGNEEVGHCCFTSQQVVEIVHGKMYAGGLRQSFAKRGSDDRGVAYRAQGVRQRRQRAGSTAMESAVGLQESCEAIFLIAMSVVMYIGGLSRRVSTSANLPVYACSHLSIIKVCTFLPCRYFS